MKYTPAKRQQCSRVPPYRPGDYVRLRPIPNHPHSGGIQRVRSLTCAITQPEQVAQWRVCFDDGMSVPVRHVERAATAEEVEWVRRRSVGR